MPLGPFCAKNFATTISPWVVTLEALEPFRTKTYDQSNPKPLPYLQDAPEAKATYDVSISAFIKVNFFNLHQNF